MVLLEDKTGESPLSLVWDTWAEKMDGKKTLQAFLQAEQDSPKEMKGKLKKSWENANKLLQAAYPSAPFRILHVTSSIVCHRSLFLMAKALYPETAREVDSLGQNALHLAAASSSIEENSKFVILSLLGLYPEAAQISDEKDGSLPLHVAAANPVKSQWDADGVSDIYDAYPYAINVADKNARLPLHHAAASSKIVRAENTMASDSSLDASQPEETSILMNLIHRFPRAATSSDLLGFLPMHYFVKHQTEWKEEANALYEANQGALTVRGGERQHLPLHLALSNPNPNRTIITKLVELHPRAAMQANKDGQLPLHIACETDKDWINGGVESVYQAYTQGIRTREANERGWYPLQIASASSKAPLSLIHQLARHFPEAARQRDNDDRLALHLVCEAGKGWCNGVKEVFRAHPLANVSEDKDGMLPFHRAALNFASVSQSCRREVDDNTTQLKDEDPSALSEEEQVEVLFELLRAHPIIVQ
eukprot:CAMPEP_0202453620 /NCGR_PEP_ID=MMETSP1360-20130828/11552_1 /ASSEMBLY_ACC=CAM_ASM_000848 /TAXON_ID=515479 /ORGANISM="Licmophora paradoxa, Strain CCMP2313" /LENGTH=478 /DNA_ID=CAMNT_0049072763 /DNA_START=78 /DNA_END=1514 /DNA_ORIENTATION=+